MATNPFDRAVINLGERPVSLDINQLQSASSRSLMWLVQAIVSAFQTAGGPPAGGVFFGSGFKVTAGGGTPNVNVTAGFGAYYDTGDTPSAIGSVAGVDDQSPMKPLALASTLNFAITPDNALTRTDIIEVKTSSGSARRLEQPSSRDILNVVTGVIAPAAVNKVLAFYLDNQSGVVQSPASSTAALGYKKGVPGGGTPATTAGYTLIATITVAANALTITTPNIADNRPDSGLTAFINNLIPAAAVPAAGSIARDFDTDGATVVALNNAGYTTVPFARSGSIVGGVLATPASGKLKVPATAKYLLQFNIQGGIQAGANLFARLFNVTAGTAILGTSIGLGFGDGSLGAQTFPTPDGGISIVASLTLNDEVIVQAKCGSLANANFTMLSGGFSALKIGT